MIETQNENNNQDENAIKEISEKLDKNNELLINLQNSFFKFNKMIENQNFLISGNNNTKKFLEENTNQEEENKKLMIKKLNLNEQGSNLAPEIKKEDQSINNNTENQDKKSPGFFLQQLEGIPSSPFKNLTFSDNMLSNLFNNLHHDESEILNSDDHQTTLNNQNEKRRKINPNLDSSNNEDEFDLLSKFGLDDGFKFMAINPERENLQKNFGNFQIF